MIATIPIHLPSHRLSCPLACHVVDLDWSVPKGEDAGRGSLLRHETAPEERRGVAAKQRVVRRSSSSGLQRECVAWHAARCRVSACHICGQSSEGGSC